MSEDRRFLSVLAFCVAGALVSFVTLVNRPSATNIRTIDLVHLITTGFFFGAALVALLVYFGFRNRGPG
jgi:hypothetical protein